MSVPSIAPYFPFRRIKLIDQTVTGMNRRFPGRDLHPLVTCTFVAHQYLVYLALTIVTLKSEVLKKGR